MRRQGMRIHLLLFPSQNCFPVLSNRGTVDLPLNTVLQHIAGIESNGLERRARDPQLPVASHAEPVSGGVGVLWLLQESTHQVEEVPCQMEVTIALGTA